jgi:hypothetical protein
MGLPRCFATEPAMQMCSLQETCRKFMVGIHADGVQYTTSMRAGGAKSIIVCSINCLSGASDKLTHQRHPLFVLQKAKLCKCGCQGYHTLQALFRVVAWSFQCLLPRPHPDLSS